MEDELVSRRKWFVVQSSLQSGFPFTERVVLLPLEPTITARGCFGWFSGPISLSWISLRDYHLEVRSHHSHERVG